MAYCQMTDYRMVDFLMAYSQIDIFKMNHYQNGKHYTRLEGPTRDKQTLVYDDIKSYITVGPDAFINC